MPTAVEPRRLGPYELVSLIGSGGMGEVYRARDTRLNREVAVKTVAVSVEEEARAISALNHPNILTIHDIGSDNGTPYLVTELVEGTSLREELRAGAMPVRRLLDYGVQIAGGLAAAHAAGVVHRDLKPENIMITRDGRVKILDFGIARRDEPQSDNARTLGRDEDEGHLLGTTAYMSPEQARGSRVTHYADQFALGLILHEMATGEAVFRRDTPLQTLSAILTEDPPALEVGSPVFQWLVKRCLHKEPDHRYASTTDLLRELENIRANLTAEQPAPAAPARRNISRWPWIAAAALAAAILGYVGGRATSVLTAFPAPHFVPFASTDALEVSPAWSPNGRSIAYSAPVNGVFQVFVRSLNGSQATQLTTMHADAAAPFWSPDASRVYFISSNALWSVGATGGSPVKLLDNVANAAIARDGRTLAAVRHDPGTNVFSLWLGSLTEGSTLKRLTAPPALQWTYLAFSPDGSKLAAWMSLPDGRSELHLYPAAGGRSRRMLNVLSASPMAREFAWMPDSKRIVFADRSGLSIGTHLFIADLAEDTIQPLTRGTSSEFSPSVAPNARAVAFAAASIDYDVVRIGFDGAMSNVAASRRFEVSPALRSGGEMAYVTDRNGEPEIWLGDRALVKPDSFGEDRTAFLFDLDFSPDGRRLAYRRSGSDDEAIWISTIAGDPPVRLGKEPGDAFQRAPSWSPDGNWIVYYSMRNGRYALVRARAGGMESPVVIAEDAGTYPQWAPRGDLIAAIGPREGITILQPDGTNRRAAGEGAWLLHGWSADGATIYGVKRDAGATLSLVSVPASGGPETKIASLGPYPAEFSYGASIGSMPLRGFSLLPDGRGFLTSVLRATSDIWLLERDRR